jgi:hypothetical protein
MKKETARALLGKTDADIARQVGVTREAVRLLPEHLPRRFADRVIAARVRMEWRAALERGDAAEPLPELIADALN